MGKSLRGSIYVSIVSRRRRLVIFRAAAFLQAAVNCYKLVVLYKPMQFMKLLDAESDLRDRVNVHRNRLTLIEEQTKRLHASIQCETENLASYLNSEVE